MALSIVVALGGSAFFLLNSRERASLNGTWIARMQRAGSRPYNIRLEFRTVRNSLSGRVEYPTGSAAIQGGTIQNGRLAFFTRHTPQFESEPATITFAGELRGRELELHATTPDGTVTQGVARKTE